MSAAAPERAVGLMHAVALAMQGAVEAEREACAAVADARAERTKSKLDEDEMERGARFAAEDIAYTIRRRA